MADHCYWDGGVEDKHFKIVFSETEKGSGRKSTPVTSRAVLTTISLSFNFS